jgi:hypothetical protein
MQERIRTGCDLGHVQFFRTRLLISNSEQISKLVDNMEKEYELVLAADKKPE